MEYGQREALVKAIRDLVISIHNESNDTVYEGQHEEEIEVLVDWLTMMVGH